MPKKTAKKPAKKAPKKAKDEKYTDDVELSDEPEEFLDEPSEHSTETDHDLKVKVGERDEDVYTEEGREDLEESDEVAPWEEGFSEGASHGGENATCAHCDKVLGDRDEDEIIERRYKGENMKFCSEKCAQAGPKGKK